MLDKNRENGLLVHKFFSDSQESKKKRSNDNEHKLDDWRAIYQPLKVSEDSIDCINLAKGKEIKRPKEETIMITEMYINEFTNSSRER